MNSSPDPEIVDFDEADTRLAGTLSPCFRNSYDRVLLFDGDLSLDGDFLGAVAKIADLDGVELVVIRGDLTVSGPIALYEQLPALYVGGVTRAETLEGGDCEILIQDAAITHLVYGDYMYGALDAGNVETPWVINSHHELHVSAPGARWVDNDGDDADADFGCRNIVESFVEEVVDPEYASIKVPEFLNRLRAGLPVLRPGVQTERDAVSEEIARAMDERVDHLDLSNRRLKQFPAEVLRMPWLRTLILDGNPIKRLPEEISTLTELEHLSLRDSRLAELPASIGELSRLRVLRIAGSGSLDFAVYPSYQPITLPETIGRLTALEELDVSRLSSKPDTDELLPEITPFPLPESVSELTSLRRLVADGTNLVFPESMPGLAALEEISMAGAGTWKFLRRFPEAVTGFPNLRKLDLRGNIFSEIPDTLLRLTNLEELNLDNSLGFVERPLPDFSLLPGLRVLRLKGRSPHIYVPYPPQELLRPVLANPLPALAELGISSWSPDDGGGRGPLTKQFIIGLGAWKSLKRIDLSYNGLTDLPEGFFTLEDVEQIDLRCNALPEEVRERLSATYPHANIDLRDQQELEDEDE